MSLGILGLMAILAAFAVMAIALDPWRLDLRKIAQAQGLFWFGMLALTMVAFMGLAAKVMVG